MMESLRISIVIVVHDQADLLEQNLPQFIETAGQVDAEVIVVDDMSSDSTPDILQRMRKEHERLYTTFLPESVIINPSRIRLALSVGVKAARGQRIVIGDISRPPVSTEWVTGMDDGEVAVVFTSRKEEITHLVASDLNDLRAMIIKAERKGGRGHQGKWQKQHRGLYDAVAIRQQKAFELVKLFDLPVSRWQLLGLRLRTWF